MKFIQKILFEASLDKDMEAEQTAQKYIKQALELISQFPKTNKVSYNPKDMFITVVVGKLKIQIFSPESSYSKQATEAGQNAGFIPTGQFKNTLNVYNVPTTFSKENKSLSVSMPDNQKEEMKHEIIHFLDFERTGKEGTEDYYNKKVASAYKPEYMKWAQKVGANPNDQSKILYFYHATGVDPRVNNFDEKQYANDSYEMNAHFMEFVMPKINKFIENKGEIPDNFNSFKEEIIDKNQEFSRYYNNLEDKNKKRFLKRLAVYYQSIRNYVVKDPEVKFDKANSNFNLKGVSLSSIFGKIKSVFSSK